MRSISTKKIAVFDIESNNWIDFLCLGFFDGREYRVFTDINTFLDTLDNARYDGFTIYAHNGGKFDFLFILERLMLLGWIDKDGILPRGGSIIRISCTTKRARFSFADSLAILPLSLKKLTHGFEVEHRKKDMPFVEGKRIRMTKRLLTYLEYDCRGLYEVLQTFFALDYIGKPQLTIASQALDTFRTFFCPSEMVRVPLDEEDEFRERFYSGGRVEVYKGRGMVNVYDVNSLFPFAMLGDMPTGEAIRTRKEHRANIGFYEITVRNTPEWYISPFLVKTKTGNAYPRGAGTYYCGSPTLEFLRDSGVRYTVNSGVYFRGKAPLFDEYVHTFYKMKQENKGKPLYLLAKLFLNSLYGRFALRRYREKIVPASSEEGLIDASELLKRYGYALRPENSRSEFILPYLAAFITERARLHHYRLMAKHPRSMFYCDTDSLFTSANYASDVGTEIGQLSFEGTYEGIFLSPKNYALRNSEGLAKCAFKGFDTSNFNWRQFVQAQNACRPESGSEFRLTEKRKRPLSFSECGTRVGGIIHERNDFLKVVETEKVANPEIKNRLTIWRGRYTFDTVPLERENVKSITEE